MKLVELTGVKGGAVWVNAGQLIYVGLGGGGAGGSMYGDNNVSTSAKLHFADGSNLEVKESVPEVVARLGG
jgi:hypothetical protein